MQVQYDHVTVVSSDTCGELAVMVVKATTGLRFNLTSFPFLSSLVLTKKC